MAAILLLEDDELLSKQIATMLEREGHSVEQFTLGTPAAKYLETYSVDLVIADIFIEKDGSFIPDGGIKLISHIRQLRLADTPIIAISGSFGSNAINQEHAMTTVQTVGASALLPKPFHPDALLDMVKNLLNRSRA